MDKIIQGKYKIAVVEDDEMMSESIGAELQDAGFEVVKALDGEKGLEIIQTQKPDLVLLDIALPKMDGLTILKHLREGESNGERHIPVILLTNLNADDKIMGSITRDEPSFYLTKSKYTLADVVEKVKTVLKT